MVKLFKRLNFCNVLYFRRGTKAADRHTTIPTKQRKVTVTALIKKLPGKWIDLFYPIPVNSHKSDANDLTIPLWQCYTR